MNIVLDRLQLVLQGHALTPLSICYDLIRAINPHLPTTDISNYQKYLAY